MPSSSEEEEEDLHDELYEGASEKIQKNRLLSLFEKFQAQYESLSRNFRVSLVEEQRLLEKCQDLKSTIALNGIKLQSDLKMQAQELKNVQFYREECNLAWKDSHLSKQREMEARTLINELSEEIKSLKGQMMRLRRLDHVQSDSLLKKSKNQTPLHIGMSFEEWKRVNTVWIPGSHPSTVSNPSTSATGPRSNIMTPMQRASSRFPHL